MGVPLRTLEEVSREMIRDAILDAVANPSADTSRGRGGRPRTIPLSVVKMVVFLEMPLHFHVAVRLSSLSRFAPLKAALRSRHGLASHWSTTHSEWWSAVRYGVFTTQRKPSVDASPLMWAANGKALSLHEEAQQPFLAAKRKRDRELAEQLAHSSGGATKKQPGFNKLDLYAVIIDKKLRTTSAVMAYVQGFGSQQMQLFIARAQRKLADHISDAWEWDAARSKALEEEQSEWNLLEALAMGLCSGTSCDWRAGASEFFARNAHTINEGELAAALARVIKSGPSKTARVPLITGPTNAGKSTILDPIDEVFGAASVFHTPALGSSMALSNLVTKPKKFIFLDDYRPVEFATVPRRPCPTIPLVTFLKLMGGQWFEVQVSQSFNNGNVDCRWTKGVAMTAKLDGLWDPTPVVSQEDIRHMQSRVHQFTASAQIETPMREMPKCKYCFAAWLLEAASRFGFGPPPLPLPAPSNDDAEDEIFTFFN
ncbi:unnamed protein product [Polarella glacialis]|uniref:Uncharacterized protein n=1 Tax=Polarella glacialis TaxID=89957 RepID=A0A813GN73_POLGL|nr:unnamed protein product [Polarella glacialis]